MRYRWFLAWDLIYRNVLRPGCLLVFVAATCLCAFASFAHSTDTELQEAIDRVEISNVIAGAMLAYDRKDSKDFSSYFAPDGEMRIEIKPTPVVFKGAALRNIFSEDTLPGASADPRFVFTRSHLKLAVGENRHLVTSSYIKLVGPNKALHWAYWSWVLPAEQNGAPVTMTEMGNYRDELVKINGRWFFSKRAITFGPLKPE